MYTHRPHRAIPPRPHLERLEVRQLFTSPAAPVIIEPDTDGQVVSNFDVHMEIDPAAYFDADGHAHQATSWQIRETAGNGGAAVWQALSVTDTLSKQHIHLGDGAFVGTLAGRTALLAARDYVLHATFTDSNGEVSATTTRPFRTAADTVPVPGAGTWIAYEGYRVELAAPAQSFRLPVNVAFVPNPGPNPTDPLYYVAELYGSIKVVNRAGQASTYASSLLDYDPTGPFSGTGEQGLTGLAVDPATGDLFVGLLWNNGTTDAQRGGPTVHFPKVERLHSNDGGRTMATRTVLLNMQPETQGQSHQISNVSIGPDSKLYVHMGDGFNASVALDMTQYRGKVLRMNLNGTAATDNPFYNAGDGITARDFVFTSGHRNPFGGAWRASNGVHYVVENGNALDRMVNLTRGQSYGWAGNDSQLSANSIYVWNPATAPVNMAFVQPQTFGGSLFPASSQDDGFVSLSGPTYAAGPQALGKRIEWFPNLDTLNGSGKLATPPLTLVRYNGTGRGTITALAAGPDGLYFADMYRDDGAGAATAAGANVYRLRYVDFHPRNVTAAAGDGRVNLAWTADALAASYNVYRSTGAGALSLIAGGVGGASFTDATAVNGTQYRYVVRGVNAGGESSDSNDASATPVASPPTVASPAAAGPVPPGGTTVSLGVLGADDEGEPNLTYTWALAGTPPAAVAFSANGNNAAKTTTATFAAPGTYDFVVTLRDAQGNTAQSSVAVTVAPAPPAPPGSGNGLIATYFNNKNLTGTSVVRTDSRVAFNFGGGSPHRFIDADTFSARWVGELEPRYSETYTFNTASDDGVRLWVDGQLVIDGWYTQTLTNQGGTIALQAGQRYAIRMEYFDNTGPAVVKLTWCSPSQPREIVPRSQLFCGTPIKVNFQPAGAPVPLGYLPDSGAAFADRGNGRSYGWSGDNTAAVLDQDSARSPDQRYDTLALLQGPALPAAVWEMAVPNGTYRVHVVSGDAARTNSVYKVSVEGVLVASGTPTAAKRWIEGWRDVVVSDGRLTIASAAGARNNKINFLDVLPPGAV